MEKWNNGRLGRKKEQKNGIVEQIFSGILCFRDLLAKKKNATKTLRHKIAQKEN